MNTIINKLESILSSDISMHWCFASGHKMDDFNYYGQVELFCYYEFCGNEYYIKIVADTTFSDNESPLIDSISNDYDLRLDCCTFTDLPSNVDQNDVYSLMFEYMQTVNPIDAKDNILCDEWF